MSNGIAKRQNSDVNITRLAAQRQMYSDVGTINLINLLLSVVVPVGFIIIQASIVGWNWPKFVIVCFPMVMIIISRIISITEKRKKELAASIQQEFDIDVYQMPWDDKLFGTKKNLNYEIVGAAKRILGNEEEKKLLYNWYTPKVDTLPINQAISACQKENFNWDAGLRKRYRLLNVLVLLLLIVVPTIISLYKEETVLELLTKLYIVLPAISWLTIKISQLDDDLKRMASLETLVSNFGEKQMDQLQLTQKGILLNRESAVKVPNWFYKLFKDNDEDRVHREIELHINSENQE